MIKVMFVCLGNICRSPMAQFVLQDIVKKRGLENEFLIASSATSREEVGNCVHYGTKKKLAEYGISCDGKTAVVLTKEDYAKYDYILAMETHNVTNIIKIIGKDTDNKVFRLLDFSSNPRDIADPWYTGDFDVTYDDILEGCEAFLNKIFN